MILLPTQMR